MTTLFNENLCHSVKSKKSFIQCTSKPKCNEVFCGKHLNKKKIILYNQNNNINYDINNSINSNNILNEYISHVESIDDIFNSKCIEDSIIDTDKNIYNKEELFNRISNNIYTSVYSLRASIKDLKLNGFISTKKSKSFIIQDLKKFIARERYFSANKESIILIQSIVRKWFILKRTKCINDTDILTFTDKYDISGTYLYIFEDNITNKSYAFDIRTFVQLISCDNPTCPYTFREYTESEKNKVMKRARYLESRGIKVEIEKPKLSVEEEMEMKMKDLFYKINMLDNYTSHTWFKNLALDQLIDLYVKSEDVWSYRSNMSPESKKKIVHNGLVFTIPPNIIRSFSSKIKLQNILLDEFNRMVTEGVDINEKKLGAILILTGLVEVSFEAAEALPHLIQI
jgi:hypothetical protein